MSEPFDPYYLWLGIPPEELAGGGPNHYRLLGLRLFEPNREVISYAVDQRSTHLRSLQTGKRGPESQRLLNDVAAAGVCLLDDDKKRAYDRHLLANLKMPAAGFAARPIAESAPPEPPVSRAEPTFSAAVAPPPRADGSESLEWSSGPQVVTIDSPEVGEPAPAPEEWPEEAPSAAGPPKLALTVGAAAGALALLSIAAVVVGLVASAPDSGTDEEPPGPHFAAGAHHTAPIPPETGPVETRPAESSLATANDGEANPVVTPPVTAKLPANPPATSTGQISPAAREAWVPIGTPDFAIRKVNGQWVEMRPRVTYWLEQLESGTTQYEYLRDPRRGLEFRLFRDHMEVASARQAWSWRAAGTWVAADELPEFATASPRPSAAGPLPRIESHAAGWHAMVFRGRQTVHVPLPEELRHQPADFTIEGWIRCDRARPDGVILSTPQSGAVVIRSRGSGRFTNLEFSIDRTPPKVTLVATEDWVHLALVRNGSDLRLFVDGKPQPKSGMVTRHFLLRDEHLVLGDPANGFRGLVRDLRISRTVRYREPFTPPYRLASDVDTLTLLHMEGMEDPRVQDVSGRGGMCLTSGIRWLPLTPEGQLAADRVDGQVDLLQAFVLETDRLDGYPFEEPQFVEMRVVKTHCRLALPYPAPPEYDLSVEFTRVEGSGGPFIGLAIGGRPAVLALNAFPASGDRTGILPADLTAAATCSTMQGRPLVLRDGETTQVDVKVRLEGTDQYRVSISQGGNSLAEITGQFSELGVPSELAWPGDGCFSLGSAQSRVRFTRLLLTRVTPDLPAEKAHSIPAPETTPATTNPPVTTPAVTSEAKPAPPPSRKRSVPPAEELAAEMEEARKLYEDDVRKATKAEEKKSLAQQIYQAGQRATDDDTARYVLHELARKLYIQAGDVTLVISISRTIEDEYGMPYGAVVLAGLQALDDVSLSHAYRLQVSQAASALADRFFADNDYDLARQAADLAQKSANRLSDPLLRKTTGEQHAKVARIADGFAAVRPHLKTLESGPADKAANLAAGKFYCLVLEDWPRGLPYLDASGDAVFAGPARLDLATAPAKWTATDRLKVAETWLQVAATNSAGDRDDRRAIQRRAKSELEAALPNLSGLEKVRAEKRLRALPDLGPARRASGEAAPSPETAGGLQGPRLIGSVSRNDVDVGVLVQYQLGHRLTMEDTNQLARAAAAAGGDNAGQTMSLSLYSEMSLPARQEILFSLSGAPALGGVNTVIVDGNMALVIRVGENDDNNRTMTLAAGKHTVRWVITGAYIPPRCSLQIGQSSPADGGAPAFLVAPDAEREAALLQERAGRVLTLGQSP